MEKRGNNKNTIGIKFMKKDSVYFRIHDHPELFDKEDWKQVAIEKEQKVNKDNSKQISLNSKKRKPQQNKQIKRKNKLKNKTTKIQSKGIECNYIDKYKIKQKLICKLLNYYHHERNFNKEEKELFDKMLNSSRKIDTKLCAQSLICPAYTRQIIDSFKYYIKFVDKQIKRNEFDKIIRNVNIQILNSEVKCLLNIYLRNCSYVEIERFDYIGLSGKICNIPYTISEEILDNNILVNDIKNFLTWLNFDIQKMIDYVFDNYTDNDGYIIISKRGEGKTLKQIAAERQISSSRVSYIEYRYIDTFVKRYRSCDYDLIAILKALDEQCTITHEHIVMLLGEDKGNLLWYIVQKGKLNCELYTYSNSQKALNFDGV